MLGRACRYSRYIGHDKPLTDCCVDVDPRSISTSSKERGTGSLGRSIHPKTWNTPTFTPMPSPSVRMAKAEYPRCLINARAACDTSCQKCSIDDIGRDFIRERYRNAPLRSRKEQGRDRSFFFYASQILPRFLLPCCKTWFTRVFRLHIVAENDS